MKQSMSNPLESDVGGVHKDKTLGKPHGVYDR
jgi:hypothetical protein